MSSDQIRYDLLAQEALRGVVRRVLTDVARTGLPGDHHFFIAFATEFPGVRISQRLRAQYPGEMTIVLQHQFWDLTVNDNAFEIGLSFSGVPERLYVPFDAIKGFFDPSVQFGLQFEVEGVESAPAAGPDSASEPDNQPAPVSHIGTTAKAETPRKTRGAASEPQAIAPKAEKAPKAENTPKGKPAGDDGDDDDTPPTAPDGGSKGAEVVSLDRFRKKT